MKSQIHQNKNASSEFTYLCDFVQGQKTGSFSLSYYLKIGTPSCWQVFVRFEETLTPSGILNLVKLEIYLKKFPNM